MINIIMYIVYRSNKILLKRRFEYIFSEEKIKFDEDDNNNYVWAVIFQNWIFIRYTFQYNFH